MNLTDCEQPTHKIGCDQQNRSDCQACVWLREQYLDALAYQRFLYVLQFHQFGMYRCFGRG